MWSPVIQEDLSGAELNWTELCMSHNYQAETKACVHVYRWAYWIGDKGLISAEKDIDWPTRPVD